MEALSKGFATVHRNLLPLAIYSIVIVAVNLMVFAAGDALASRLEESATARTCYKSASNLILALVFALCQSLFFAKFAAYLGKPWWRFGAAGDALGRFFKFWLILSLLQLLTTSFLMPDNENMTLLVLQIYLLLITVSVPFGAVVMFLGKVDAETLKQVPSLLSSRPLYFIIIVCFSGLVSSWLLYAFIDMAQPSLATVAVVQAIDCYKDCVVFCATFVACMMARDAQTC